MRSSTGRNEVKTDTIRSLDDAITFTNIPHRYLGKEVHVTANCANNLPIDTTFTLAKDVVLNIRRDPSVYGDVHFRLWNPATETTVPNVEVDIAGQTAISDEEGRISLIIPLEVQREAYPISASVPLTNTTIYMPYGPMTLF